VNAVDATLSVGDPVPSTAVDLDSLLTHEAGHLLGLAHNTMDKTATMFPGYSEGTDSLRTLAADDIDGICALYPPTRQVSSTSCEPRHGYSDLCGAQQTTPPPDEDTTTTTTSKGCGISRGSARAPFSVSVTFAGLLGLIALRSARRRKRRARATGRAS